MTIIKATCPTCGEVDLTAEQVELRISSESNGGTYGFECPVCVSWVSKAADSRIIQLLISGGVKPEVVEGDDMAGPYEPAAVRRPEPAFTHDDLLDFHLQMERVDTVEALFGLISR